MHQFTMTLKTHDLTDHLWMVLGDRWTGKLMGNAVTGKEVSIDPAFAL